MSENPENPENPEPAAGQPAVIEPPAAELPVSEAPVSSEPVVSEPVVKKPRDRRRIATVVATGVVLVAVVAGAAWTVVTVRGADRDAGAAVWRLPEAAAGTKTDKATGLRGMLLPYGKDTYRRGPDMAQFGSDAELSGAQAAALQKESLKDLPRSQRRELERQIDRNPVKGVAMRSYVKTAVSPVDEYTMQIQLAQMENQRTVRSVAAGQRQLLDALKVLRKGPEIEGYKDSTACYLPVADSAEKLDTMICTGYVGDVLVTGTAIAAKPLDKKSAADMLRAQLDRIKDPGAAV
ncbi:hypothetical protein EDD90_5952 [Streptomyces sp. Ag109_O5-1]|uniref:hypothetical protein n=1 Tax=Streptomyces sp. Ag109_O5-1 TaxID=1938851 RepID=UPI000FB01ADC|nr:hypothetical protein [Streptomyces sp. Ag109_O5-1]RPE42790.1 hypothetical protein EDD90_5952 [Streptomyces sp. Ag109_O5-1]